MDPTALAAANLADIAEGFAGEAGKQWLITHARHDKPATAPRAIQEQALCLTDRDMLARLPRSADVMKAWDERRVALTAYRQAAGGDSAPDTILGSFLHMHHIRAIGLNRDSERRCQRLARAIAISSTYREIR